MTQELVKSCFCLFFNEVSNVKCDFSHFHNRKSWDDVIRADKTEPQS